MSYKYTQKCDCLEDSAVYTLRLTPQQQGVATKEKNSCIFAFDKFHDFVEDNEIADGRLSKENNS
jgi:hypothetical protein